MRGEAEIRSARESYAHGSMSLEEFETRVWDVLTGKWSPTSALATVLKEAWTDAPGAVDVYRPRELHDWHDGKGAVHRVSRERHLAKLYAMNKAKGL